MGSVSPAGKLITRRHDAHDCQKTVMSKVKLTTEQLVALLNTHPANLDNLLRLIEGPCWPAALVELLKNKPDSLEALLELLGPEDMPCSQSYFFTDIVDNRTFDLYKKYDMDKSDLYKDLVTSQQWDYLTSIGYVTQEENNSRLWMSYYDACDAQQRERMAKLVSELEVAERPLYERVLQRLPTGTTMGKFAPVPPCSAQNKTAARMVFTCPDKKSFYVQWEYDCRWEFITSKRGSYRKPDTVRVIDTQAEFGVTFYCGQ